MTNFQGILFNLKCSWDWQNHIRFSFYVSVVILASIHIHKYSRIAVLYSHFQTEAGRSEIGNKDFLRKSRRQKHGFSIRITTLVVGIYSVCVLSTSMYNSI